MLWLGFFHFSFVKFNKYLFEVAFRKMFLVERVNAVYKACYSSDYYWNKNNFYYMKK